MNRLKFIIKRSYKSDSQSYCEKQKSELPYENIANALMSAEDFIAYIKNHGYHFTNKLAEYVSKKMINVDKSQHSWTAQEVKTAIKNANFKIPSGITDGDVTYLANMYYADLYPNPLQSEEDCIKAAYKIANDPDGYEGMIFCRWIADAIGKSVDINWKDFV